MIDVRHVNAETLTRAGALVGDVLEQAAKPVPVPTPVASTSPADVAANALAELMHALVTQASAELASIGPRIREAAAQAAAALTATDEGNAERLTVVPAHAGHAAGPETSVLGGVD